MKNHGLWMFCAVVFLAFGLHCRKSEDPMAAKKVGKLKGKVRSRTKRAMLKSGQLSQELQRLTVAVQKASLVYKAAFKKGRVVSWSSYHQAQAALKEAMGLYRRRAAALKRYNPRLARQLKKSLSSLRQAFKAKASPRSIGGLAYRLLYATRKIAPQRKNMLLSAYLRTLKRCEKLLRVEKVQQGYRVGLVVEPPTPSYRWYKVGRSFRRAKLMPPPKSRWKIGVFLRDALGGSPLYDAEISVEWVDAKSKKGRKKAPVLARDTLPHNTFPHKS